MDIPLALVTTESTKMKPEGKDRIWRERPLTEDVLFRGTDEGGRSGWFLRLTVSGMYPRRVGPYWTKAEAINALEEFVADVYSEPFLNVMNAAQNGQAFIVEGVPILRRSRKDHDR
jgi:hypothetical protein